MKIGVCIRWATCHRTQYDKLAMLAITEEKTLVNLKTIASGPTSRAIHPTMQSIQQSLSYRPFNFSRCFEKTTVFRIVPCQREKK